MIAGLLVALAMGYASAACLLWVAWDWMRDLEREHELYRLRKAILADRELDLMAISIELEQREEALAGIAQLEDMLRGES